MLNTNKIYLTIIFLVLSFPITVFSEENIAGIWSATARTKGGLGSQWSFSKKNEVSITFGALVDYKYEVKDNLLLMQIPEEKITKSEYVIDNDTLTIKSEESQQPKIFKWAGAPVKKDHPLIGNWTFVHSTGQTALMRYTSHGLAQLSIPFVVETGFYSIKLNQLIISLNGKEQRVYDFKRNNKNLSLQDLSTNEITNLELLEY